MPVVSSPLELLYHPAHDRARVEGRPPMVSSGLRIGTSALATRGLRRARYPLYHLDGGIG